MSKRPSRLGRGLSSLMGQGVGTGAMMPPKVAATSPSGAAAVAGHRSGVHDAGVESRSTDAMKDKHDGGGLRHIPLEAISANPYQPRKTFDQEALQHLADSIKRDGLMQPVVLRIKPNAGGTGGEAQALYELVAGERRWRAAQLAGLTALPAIIRPLDDRQVAEWALIENLQREDLNVIERAEAFSQLSKQFSLSHDQIAQQVGVDRSTITNALRLLALQPDVRQLVIDNRLSGGQAKALAGVADPKRQMELAQRAIKGEWSVRQLETAVRNLSAPHEPPVSDAGEDGPRPAGRSQRAAHLRDLEEQIAQQLNTRVAIRPGRKKGTGTLTIEFYSLDQFDALLQRLEVRAE